MYAVFVTADASRVHLRTKVTSSLHLTYSKKRGKPGVGIEIDKYSLFLNILKENEE